MLRILNGYALWQGKSRHDGKPIVCIANGFKSPSSNIKTGPMVQVSLMRADVAPHVAVTTGADESVCNDCELRQYTVHREAMRLKTKPGAKPPMCYVITHMGPRETWKSWKRGIYGEVDKRAFPYLFRRKRTRLGTYGNMSNAPISLTEQIVGASEAHTMYDHNWRRSWAQPWKEFAMASVASPLAKEEANAMGWRTFRIKRPEEQVLPDEVVCPASEEAGHKTDCYHCRLCCGTQLKAKNVVINDHGPTSQGLAKKRNDVRWGRADPELVQLGILRRGSSAASPR